MGFSIGKILKREPESQTEEKLIKESTVEANKTLDSKERTETKKKHGEPGMCCGSCS